MASLSEEGLEWEDCGEVELRARNESPVFVVGCPRSGTTLLYSMLESAGGFPVYHAETAIFELLAPNFGDLRDNEQVARALAVWEKSDQCAIAGLDMGPVRRRILAECRNPGDFLRIFMEGVARQQGVARWAEKTPMHLLHMREIKRTIPEAIFLHIIRDGRDVAVSLGETGWVPPLPWDRSRGVLVAGIFWRWVVGRGVKIGREIGEDYLEVHYEDLLREPQRTLDRIGAFIGQPLHYDEILRTGIGAVRRPNTSFGSDLNFIGRWRKRLTPEQLAQLDHLIGPLLDGQGYRRSAAPATHRRLLEMTQEAYEIRWTVNYWPRMRALLKGRWASLGRFEPGSPDGPPPCEGGSRPSGWSECSS